MKARLFCTMVAVPLLVVMTATGALAQDFPETQTSINRVLFAKEDAAAVQRAAEQRRIEALDRQTREQAADVQQLNGQLEQVRDERRLIDLAAAFDAAIVARDWPAARSALAANVAVDLAGRPNPAPAAAPADTVIARLAAFPAAGAISPRYNQRVLFDNDRATLVSDGRATYPQGRSSAPRSGSYEYGFQRTADGWKIDRIVFRPSTGTVGSIEPPLEVSRSG